MAEAVAPAQPRAAASEDFREVSTPTQTACADVAALLGVDVTRTVKAVAVVSETQADEKAPVVKHFTLLLVRGDHEVNEIKAGKLAGLKDHRLATEAEIVEFLVASPASSVRWASARQCASLPTAPWR
jgi:prolyl-tRNA synthetase